MSINPILKSFVLKTKALEGNVFKFGHLNLNLLLNNAGITKDRAYLILILYRTKIEILQ